MEKFSEKITVRYSDIGPEGYADIAQIMAWFQDAATNHSKSKGYGSEVLREMGAAWIVLHWDICMHAHVAYTDVLTVTTWASGFASAYGHRMFTLENEAGECVAEAESVWMLYDFKKNRFLKVSEEMCAGYGCDTKMSMDVLRKWKLSAPEAPEQTFTWQVRRSDTDTNQHTNNVSYVRFLLDCIENGGAVQHVRVTYKKALYLNESAKLILQGNTAAVLRDEEVCTLFEFE